MQLLTASSVTVDGAALLAFAIGIFAGYAVPKLYRFITASKDIYALDHALLNLQVPPPTLWMNMGFWDSTTSTLPEAALNLLHRLLQKSNIPRNSQILDLGFGCGDQCIELQRSFSYTGVTISRVQFAAALRRVDAPIFCADAANPDGWPEELVLRTRKTDWVVALDCMYHFRPSREGIVRVAGRELRAGLAAFDLFRNGDITMWQTAMLRVICWMAEIPWANMCTVEEYQRILEQAGGYEHVEIEDITPHVFSGLSAFIQRQDQELKGIGVGGGVGRYTGAAKLFGWLGRTGLMRACLVVARRKQ